MTTSYLADTDALARQILDCQAQSTSAWHEPGGELLPEEQMHSLPGAGNPFLEMVLQQHQRNSRLWHQEDLARAPGAEDQTIAQVKHRIDALNQERNDLVERLDELILAQLTELGVIPAKEAPWNSETPGSIIDRLSILSLKVFHTRVQEERSDASDAHREAARQRREVLETQRSDLGSALQTLFSDLVAGRKQMKLYRQYKMYNDPAWNPAVYRTSPPS